MTIYYVNSATGSDRNSGTGQNSAFATLSKVESLTLKPGDSVLLAKGSVFNEQFDIKYSRHRERADQDRQLRHG